MKINKEMIFSLHKICPKAPAIKKARLPSQSQEAGAKERIKKEPGLSGLEALFLHQANEIADAVGIAPFVVIPGNSLDEMSGLHCGI